MSFRLIGKNSCDVARFELGDEYIELKGDVLRDMLGGSIAAVPGSELGWAAGLVMLMISDA